MKPIFHDDATCKTERRAELLNEIVEYIVKHGLAGLSLRPLGAAVKSSPRMLLYYFGSKEKLISEVLAEIRLRQQTDFADAVSASGSRKERFLRVWNSWTGPRMEPLGKFWFGVYALALQNPELYSDFLKRFTSDWLPAYEQAFIAAGFTRERARSLASVSLAAMRGLQLDLLASGERTRINAAFEELLRLLMLASREGAGGAHGRTQKAKNR